MATPQLNIFITGATGYIGGMILTRLLSHKNRESFRITALVRNQDKVQKLQDHFGINAVAGSTDDSAKLADLASDADIVFSTTDCDDLRAAQSILSGIKRRYDKTGVAPVLIHTSGTGTLCDDAAGTRGTDVVYDDLNIPQIESLPDSAMHRNVDLTLVAADKEGYVRTYIVLPSVVWGLATGPLFESGISHPQTIILPVAVKTVVERGRALLFAQGLNCWSHVEIHELGDLYIKLFNAILEDPKSAAHGREGYYFGESDEFQWIDYFRAIGKASVKLGIASNPEPAALTKEDIQQFWGGSTLVGGNSRCKANRIRQLGWVPVKTTKDMLDSIEDEVSGFLRSSA